MKYYNMNVRLTDYTVRFTVLASSQEEAINKAIERAKKCNETQSNRIEATHCLNEYTL